MGYAASWITEWYAYDRARARRARPRRQRAHRRLRAYRPAGKAAGRPRPRRQISRDIVSRLFGTAETLTCSTSLTSATAALLPHDPFKAIVAPRPIGWITSISAKGEVNLAPYSYFNGVSSRPNLVMFSSEGHKDSVGLHRGDRRIRLQSRDLGFARGDERDLRAAAARHQRDGARRA